jgi:hypothetical protein
MLIELTQAVSFFQEVEQQLSALTMEIFEAQGITVIDTPEAKETARKLLTGRPLPGFPRERKPIVVTKDGYIVGNGNARPRQV